MADRRRFSTSLLLLMTLMTVGAARAENDTYQFGPDSGFNCHCAANPAGRCNRTTGRCPGPCRRGWGGVACQFGNVARSKPVTVRTKSHGYEAEENTVNGDYNMDASSYYSKRADCVEVKAVSISAGGELGWWQVDLESNHVVYRLNISYTTFQRGYQASTPWVVIKVGNESIQDRNLTLTTDKSSDPNICFQGYKILATQNVEFETFNCKQPLRGQYVTLEAHYVLRSRRRNRINFFGLCEVEVFGYKDCPVEGLSGPGCLNKCGCKDREEQCGIYGVCKSGCLDLRYGRYCEKNMKVPELMIRNSIANDLELSAKNIPLRFSRRANLYYDSSAGEVMFFYQLQKMENDSWYGFSSDFAYYMRRYALETPNNSTTLLRLRVFKVPMPKGILSTKFDEVNITNELLDRYGVAVSNTVKKCMPPAPVQDLELVAGPTAAMATWEEPEDTDPECPIHRYSLHLRYRLVKPANSCPSYTGDYQGTTDNANTTHFLKYLRPFMNYSVSVKAMVSGSYGHAKTAFFITHSAAPKNGVVRRPRVHDVTATSAKVRLHFNCTYLNGPFEQYSVKLVDLSWNKYNQTFNFTNPDQEYYAITGLKPYTNYSLTYTVRNDVAESQPSTLTLFKTDPQRPEKPTLALSPFIPWLQIALPTPTARLTEIYGQCEATMLRNETKTLPFRKNIERLSHEKMFWFYFEKELDNDEVVTMFECRAVVHSDEGPSEWAKSSVVPRFRG